MAIIDDMEKIYKTDPEFGNTSFVRNWYLQKPYTFVFTDRKKNVSTFNLPISPSNINITTHWATNVISTMYGTVEEHSEQRYYDIVISGTTGMSPRFYKPVIGTDARVNAPSEGRVGFPIKGLIPGGIKGGLHGFASRTQALVTNALNQASDLFGFGDRVTTGIDLKRTGYVAFHNFYKFLLTYKKDASGESSIRQRSKHPIKFVNFKDNNQYDVAITGFQLTRDASNPMLYNYNLTMRAYNLQDITAETIEIDIADRAAELGLDNINNESFFSTMANKARQAKNAAYAAIAAAKGFGS